MSLACLLYINDESLSQIGQAPMIPYRALYLTGLVDVGSVLARQLDQVLVLLIHLEIGHIKLSG